MKNLVTKPKKELKNPNINVARRIVALLDYGLPIGIGTPEPGKMCVEAAVCFAMGQPHSDNPKCVDSNVAEIKIDLNDSPWSSDKARAKGLKRIAIAQLGSRRIKGDVFLNYMHESALSLKPVLKKAVAKMEKASLTRAVERASSFYDIIAVIKSMHYNRVNVDKYLRKLANFGVEALQAQKSKGCKWLHLID